MSRNRILVSVLAVVAVVGAFWVAVLGPKRAEMRTLDAQVRTQRDRLATARAAAAGATAARDRYRADYSAVTMLGEAVPPREDMPSLLYEIDSAAHGAKVDFRSITSTASSAPAGSTPGAGAAPAASGTTGSATAAPATGAAGNGPAGSGPTPLPLSFVFSGSFTDVQRLLDRVNRFVAVRGDDVQAHGRLLSVGDITLAISPDGFPNVQATITATAYTMPAGDVLAGSGGATAGAGGASPTPEPSTPTTTASTGAQG
jgi:hypothetical protein